LKPSDGFPADLPENRGNPFARIDLFEQGSIHEKRLANTAICLRMAHRFDSVADLRR